VLDWDHNTLRAFRSKSRGKQPTTLVFRPQRNKNSRRNKIPTCRRRTWFQREINIYSDAKLLKTHPIGGTPINKKNVLCDWTKTRWRTDPVDEPTFWPQMHKKAYLRSRAQLTPLLRYKSRNAKLHNVTIPNRSNSRYSTLNTQTKHTHRRHPSSN